MDTMFKANVLDVKEGRAIISVNGKRKAVSVREGVKIRKGDNVFVAFGSIIDKVK